MDFANTLNYYVMCSINTVHTLRIHSDHSLFCCGLFKQENNNNKKRRIWKIKDISVVSKNHEND